LGHPHAGLPLSSHAVALDVPSLKKAGLALPHQASAAVLHCKVVAALPSIGSIRLRLASCQPSTPPVSLLLLLVAPLDLGCCLRDARQAVLVTLIRLIVVNISQPAEDTKQQQQQQQSEVCAVCLMKCMACGFCNACHQPVKSSNSHMSRLWLCEYRHHVVGCSALSTRPLPRYWVLLRAQV
jgi:hypothetical protein